MPSPRPPIPSARPRAPAPHAFGLHAFVPHAFVPHVRADVPMRSLRALAGLTAAATLLGACSSASLAQDAFTIEGNAGTRLDATALAQFDAPWAMSFLPDGRALVTEKGGTLVLVGADGERLGTIDGVPEVRPDGQGGLGDVVPHPDFADNALLYLSWIERDGRDSGAVVGRATLALTDTGGTLGPLERVWEQSPKIDSTRHYSHRIAFDGEGYLYVTSGDRGLQAPAQDLSNNLGTIVRLLDDGTPADGNPFGDPSGDPGEAAAQFWTVGHRNPLGIDVAPDGTLWAHEMGPRGGDELNRIVAGENYGWPVVSDGENYSGVPISDHDTDTAYRSPAISWVPSVSPSGLAIHDGVLFREWRGQALMGALSGRALLRVGLDGDAAEELERFEWGARVREVEEAPDGSVWVLEDQPSGRLVRLVPG